MKKALALLALLLLIAPAVAQNGTMNQTMEPTNGTMEPEDTAMESEDEPEPEGGNKTVVWIIVIVALAGLLYAYGRLKKVE